MFKNYLIVSVRNLFKQKVFAFINVSGLAIGMACAIMIFLFVKRESSFDRFHQKGDRIYRMQHIYSVVGAPLGPALQRDFPEVEKAVRVHPWMRNCKVRVKERDFLENFYLADSTFFDLFDFRFIYGDRARALHRPEALVLTKSTAERYFGRVDVLGETIVVDGLQSNRQNTLQVTGVIEDIPLNSHITFDQMGSFRLVETDPSVRILESWPDDWLATYLLLKEGADPKKIEASYADFWERHTGERDASIKLMPLRKIHLHSSDLRADYAARGDINQVRIYSAISVFVLLIACINFMNLATARSSKRAREVGVRKVLGASRKRLVAQFLGESFVMTAAAVLIAALLAANVLPAFETFFEMKLLVDAKDWLFLGAFVLGIVLVVGFVAGAYPAFFLSAFQPVGALRNAGETGKTGAGYLRKSLVVAQFTIATILMVGTLVVYHQMRFMQEQDLGFAPDQVLAINYGNGLAQKSATIKQQLLRHPAILDVTTAASLPGSFASKWRYRFEGDSEVTEEDNLPSYWIAPGLIEMLDMEMVQGRSFSAHISTDTTAFILNEAMVALAVNRYGEQWRDPIGKNIEFHRTGPNGWFMRKSGPVIGVVKDFHFRSLRHEIEPLILQNDPNSMRRILVKTSGQNLPQTIAFLEETYKSWNLDRPFGYEFLDERFDNAYDSDRKFNLLLTVICSLTIFIACLGLFGLSAFTIEQRTKEIGIRKVMGGNVPHIVKLIASDFLKLVLLAIIIASPIAWHIMNIWLQDFAYRISVQWWIVLLAGALAVIVSCATVGYQTLKAAMANPVEALRYE